ncbi:hypothetical protein [Rufibacter soli]
MENKTNQPGRQPNASAQDATSYEQDSARNQRSGSNQNQNQNQSSMNASSRQQDQSSRQQQPQGSSQQQRQPQGSSQQRQPQDSAQGGMLNNLTSGLSNVQVPQAVKDLGSNVARSFNSLTTTQKVIGGAAIALGASYWAASSQGWIGQGKSSSGRRSKSSGGTQHS